MSEHIHGRPAVYNAKNVGVSSSDIGLLLELQRNKEAQNSWTQWQSGEQVSDIGLHAVDQQFPLNQDSPIRIGRVILAFPYIHCYTVQLSGRQGTCIAAATSTHAHSPLGVRAGEVIPPNSPVLVWKPLTANVAYILAVLPSPTMHDDFNMAEVIQQGGNSGVKKIEAYRNIPKTVQSANGWVPQGCGRPMDGTINEYSRFSETGIGLFIDSFQTFLRVNESCGLWLNYFDNYAKLAAMSAQFLTYCTHDHQNYDDGELAGIKGHVFYPWEALGLYGSGTAFKDNPADRVQMDREFPFGSVENQVPDQTPIYRVVDYTSYLGQGHTRFISKPALDSGLRRLSTATQEKDIGLLQEASLIDGSYGLKSAKSVTFLKYPMIAIPRRKATPEDPTGDDLNSGGYKFSGTFGSGPDHKAKEIQADSDLPNMQTVAGIVDVLTRQFNWLSGHPFHYHQKDYHYPQEGEAGFDAVEFYRGSMSTSYVSPVPQKLNIDQRFGEVNYYKTMAYWTITDDGSIIFADGYGSEIVMGGGQIRIASGGDVMLLSGARVVTMAQESITRAHGSVDISSNKGDVRLKAENNMQMLAGNSGQGGLLLESRGQSNYQDYKQKIGEEVVSNGITLLARSSSLNSISKDVYLRTGVDEGNAQSTGDFIIDCANGRSSLVCYGRSQLFYNSEGLGIWHSPVGQDATVEQSHYFGPNVSKIHGPLAVDGRMAVTGSGADLTVEGPISSKSSIFAMKQMACSGGYPKIGDSTAAESKLGEQIDKILESYKDVADGVTKTGEEQFDIFYADNVWETGRIGDDSFLTDELGFSYRDTSAATQSAYGYSDFKFMETRWQQLGRMGQVQQGEVWIENPVHYQGNKLYPWPGKVNWVDGSNMFEYGSDGFLLFDGTKAKSRAAEQGSYENPVLKSLNFKVCDSNYSL